MKLGTNPKKLFLHPKSNFTICEKKSTTIATNFKKLWLFFYFSNFPLFGSFAQLRLTNSKLLDTVRDKADGTKVQIMTNFNIEGYACGSWDSLILNFLTHFVKRETTMVSEMLQTKFWLKFTKDWRWLISTSKVILISTSKVILISTLKVINFYIEGDASGSRFH